MKSILLFVSTIISTAMFAQKETVDIISFAPPKGWKKDVKATVTSFNYTDKKDGSWCLIGVYKSTASKGSIDADFESEWNELVAKTYHITETPDTSGTQDADGWKVKVGTGKFTYNKKPAASMLTTFSGYGKCVSIVSTTANERYLQDIQDLIASVELSKPDTNNIVAQQQTPVNQNGYAYSSTNFDDGWVSVIKKDWVEVTKGDIKVYLLYALPYDYKNFSGTGLVDRDYYWDNYVSKYFTIQTKQYKDGGEVIGSLKPSYVEGWAIDKQTGERRFIGMRLGVSPNTAYITIGSAKDEASFWEQFPKASGASFTPSDLSAMDGYNKFAITVNDITGTWQDGNTNTAQWYYVTPGGYEGYAGMTVAARSATFNFNDGGNYTSVHNGATGAVGAMNTFQQNYKGKYTVSNWNLTATNRWKGKTDKFEAWFTAVRGGRILKLKDGGMEYSLVKTK